MRGLWRGERRKCCAKRLALWVIVAAAGAVLTSVAFAQPGTTELVSVSSTGEQGNYRSGYEPTSVSADGRFVAFESYASNLVPEDTNGRVDVFVRDRLTCTTERVSLSSSGEQGDYRSDWSSISADGRFVAFHSGATNLVPGDTNGWDDIFVRDRLTCTTERVSLSSSGGQGNGGDSGRPFISADGQFVAFESFATNLVPGDTNGWDDIFVRDRLTCTTERVSLSSLGDQGNYWSYWPSVSADGRFVAFHSYSSNLVPDDTNGRDDIFVRDSLLGITERVSVSSGGEQGNGDSGWAERISADGQFVAFQSYASNLVQDDTNGLWDVFVRDRQSDTTELVSVSSSGELGNGWSEVPSMSADGRFVAFHSGATNLVPGDTNGCLDVFVRDRQSGITERVSISSSGEQANIGDSGLPSISADGRFVPFVSYASNLVPDDTNDAFDVFVHEREAEYYEVSGNVTFQHLGSGSPPSTATVRVTWKGWLFGSYETDLGPGGAYILSLPAGPLTLSVKHTHWLRRTMSADNSGGPVTGIDFSLINGDCYDDNSVDLLDLNQVLTFFGTADPMTDLDEGGTVDLIDLNIILTNFGKVGDP
jgi:Tol biopolymer transport system component